MNLAKQHVDIGVFTANTAAMLDFWQREVGLAFEALLPLGGGARQHRHGMNGSVFKLNESRDPLPVDAAPSGYRELIIAREGIDAPRQLLDPDGNHVALVRPGWEGITGVGVRLAVRDVAAHRDFFGRCLGLQPVGADQFRCGDSLLCVTQGSVTQRSGEMRGPGYRYLTMQVHDVDAEHRQLMARGVEEGRPPVTLRNIARICFIRDPDGNWIEISQRASLTGPLPPNG